MVVQGRFGLRAWDASLWPRGDTPIMMNRRTFLAGSAVSTTWLGCGQSPQSPLAAAGPEQPPSPPRPQEALATAGSQQAPVEEPAPSRLTIVGATLDLPLIDRLHRVDAQVRERETLPEIRDAGLGCVGLILNEQLKRGIYGCSPRNGVAFASTGGDGDHYSLLIREGRVDSQSPVVLTWPSEEQQTIVGESLYDFLCFGLHGGYFQVLSGNEEPPPGGRQGLWFCGHVDEPRRRVLTFLADELELVPWPWEDRRKRYQALQDRFLASVQTT